MLTRRKFLVRSASSLAFSLGVARLSQAAIGEWSQEQGGSLDLQTGLVWLDDTLLTGNIASFSQAAARAAALEYEGYTGYRLPTESEMLTAVDHGISENCPLEGGPGPDGDLWWSSTTVKGGKYAYGVDLTTGTSQQVYIKTSQIYAIFVREGT
jgi:hypothetical protein